MLFKWSSWNYYIDVEVEIVQLLLKLLALELKLSSCDWNYSSCFAIEVDLQMLKLQG